jgi:hypothetical protein
MEIDSSQPMGAASFVAANIMELPANTAGVSVMTEKPQLPWLDNAVVVDVDAITEWYSGQPRFSIPWSQIATVSVEVDPYVSGPHSCEGFWMIAGKGKCMRLPLRGKPGLDELNLRLVTLPGFDHDALRLALEAESLCQGGDFLCWGR